MTASPAPHGQLCVPRRSLHAGNAQGGIHGNLGDGTSALFRLRGVRTHRGFQLGEIPLLMVTTPLQQSRMREPRRPTCW